MSGTFFRLANGGLVRSLLGDSMGLLAVSEYEKFPALTLHGCDSELYSAHSKTQSKGLRHDFILIILNRKLQT